MARNASKGPSFDVAGNRREQPHIWEKLAKMLHIRQIAGDDPVCLSALDESTLGRFGYNEAQIHLIKEGSLR